MKKGLSDDASYYLHQNKQSQKPKEVIYLTSLYSKLIKGKDGMK